MFVKAKVNIFEELTVRRISFCVSAYLTCLLQLFVIIGGRYPLFV